MSLGKGKLNVKEGVRLFADAPAPVPCVFGSSAVEDRYMIQEAKLSRESQYAEDRPLLPFAVLWIEHILCFGIFGRWRQMDCFLWGKTL